MWSLYLMDGPDFTALGFRGMGRTGPRSSLTGRAHGDVLGCFHEFLAHLMLKPYSITVSYDLSLILIAVMFKGFNYFCCTYYYQHYIYLINFHELCKCF